MICFQISVGLTQKNVLSLGLTSKVFSKIIKEFSKISKKFHSFSKLLSNISCLFFFQYFLLILKIHAYFTITTYYIRILKEIKIPYLI